MATIFDVAAYILRKRGEMSTMKLQKLCYYAQAWSLVWDDKPLFDEEFQAWANGPVCPDLFAVTKGRFSVVESDEPGDADKLTEAEAETVDAVLEFYAEHDAQWLSRLTHLEDPWNNARAGVPYGVSCSNVITTESMAMYYGSL